MARIRISTTVDQALLAEARSLVETNDSGLLEEALTALIARHRESEYDAAYESYDAVPPDTGDEWGDLTSWRAAAANS